MSGEGSGIGGRNNHFYSSRNQSLQDRYSQSITNHNSNPFPILDHRLPRFLTLDDSNGGEGEYFNPMSENHNADDHLDDFDLNLLGHPRQSDHLDYVPHSNLHPLSNHGSRGPRLSLPMSNPLSRPARIIGDASHHFRPYARRDPEYQSPFLGNPIHMDTFHPSPASQPIFERDSSHRVRELQPGTQLITPPFYQPSNPTPPLGSRSTNASSSSELSNSSPSMRMSRRRQPQAAMRPPPAHKWTEKLHLDLGHAQNAPPVINNTRLVDPRQALPDTFRAIFPYKLFNVVQSKCFPLVYGTNDNVVISAPTGSGKTAILELAICKLVGSADPERFKIIYQAPTKSLCSERARDWEKKFSHMNLRCVELTGDTSRAQTRRVGSASIIVTTPEKWDSITRKWSDHQKLLQFVRLVLIDEVHILNDTRGATLEAVVSRMKTISADVRFVALSATVPNLEDIAKWLGRDSKTQHELARYEMFGEELRPVRLQKYVYGYDGPPNEFIFDKSLDGKLNLLLGKHSQKKPIMVFCFTRKSCESTAKCLAEWWSTSSSEDKAWPAPSKRIPVISKDLQEIVRYRVAFHHGGLGLEDRSAVEHYYLNGDLHVICCTSTLAVGVNLPCHTVVLKGTMGYSDGELQEYSDIDVMQMLGRAGRPQFDKTAVALVMTRRDKVDRYSKMVKGEQTLESTLHRNLAEHLNSEIGLGTIKDIATAKTWIGGTFLSVRMRQAPARYGADGVLNAAGADEMMEEWCERDIKLLQQHNLITLAPFGCTEYGNAMSRYMVQFETMKLLLTIPRGAKLEEMLTTLCKAVEFEEFRFKPTERPLFRKLNQSPFILHPIKETVTQTWHKVFLMVQIHLGGVELPNDKEFGHLKRSIFCEKTAIFDRLNRLIRCVVDCKAFDGDGVSTRVGLELARAIAANSWENKPTQLNQIPGFGPVTVRRWIAHGVNTVLGVVDRDFLEMERISGRNPPYGTNLTKILDGFPRLTLRAELIKSPKQNPSPQDNVTVLVKANLGHCNTKRAPNWNGKVPAVTFMAEVSDGNLAYFWRGNIKKLDEARDLELKFPVVLSGPQQIISCHFNCEEIVGTQIIKKLEPQIPASAFDGISTGERRREPPKIDLLDSDLDLEEGDEADMLNVLDASGLDNEYPGPLDAADDDFRFIDDLLSQDKSNLEDDAQKMENGKWMCHHRCRNGGTTKSGKSCSHKCCHEGVDKLRPPPHHRKAKGLAEGDEEEDFLEASEFSRESMRGDGPPNHTQGRKPGIAKSKSAGSRSCERPALELGGTSSHSTTQHGISKVGRPSLKRTRSVENAARTKPPRKKLIFNKPSSKDISLGADYIDLSMGSDNVETDRFTNTQKKHGSKAEMGRHGLGELHHKSQGSMHTPVGPKEDYRGTGSAFDGACSEDRNSIGRSNIANVNDRTPPDADSPTDYEFPDLDEFYGPNAAGNVQDFQDTVENDETLYPGVVNTLKESIDHGQDPNLSFTTVDALQKASQRLDIPSSSNNSHDSSMPLDSPSFQHDFSPELESSPPYPAVDMPEHMSFSADDNLDGLPPVATHDDEPLFFDTDSFQSDVEAEFDADAQAQQNEPLWVAEADPEIIDSFRGHISFV